MDILCIKSNKSSYLVKLPQYLLPPSRFMGALIETRLDQKLQINNRKNVIIIT